MHFITLLFGFLAGTAFAAPQDVHYVRSSNITQTPLPPIVPLNPRSGDMDLIAKLIQSPTQADRVRLLDQPGDFVFDFNEAKAPADSVTRGLGGSTVAANAKTMPALIGNGASMTLGFIGPCGMNTAHVHNRATEVNVIVKGRLVTNFIIENTVNAIQNLLYPYQMAVFPMGAIHLEFNPDCEDAAFVAGFNNEDPGVSQIAQNFFSLRKDVIQATLGGIKTLNGQDIESFREMIPDNVALGIEACLSKCGLKRNAKRSLKEVIG